MESLKRLTPFIAVAAQLQPADIGMLAAAGFRSVINNRPDGEEQGQPGSAELAAAAQANGLEYYHLPVVSGQIGDDDVAAVVQVLRGDTLTTGPKVAEFEQALEKATGRLPRRGLFQRHRGVASGGHGAGSGSGRQGGGVGAYLSRHR